MELKVYHSPGKIIKLKTNYYQDQLSEDFKGMGGKSRSRYLMDTYGLTVEEYYCLVVYGDKDYRPKCSCYKCNNRTKFGGLAFGYYKYCSQSCQVCDQQHNLYEEGRHFCQTHPDEYKEISRKGTENGIHKAWQASIPALKELADRGEHPFQSSKVQKNSYLSKHNPDDTCYLYLATSKLFPDYIKVGITINNAMRKKLPIEGFRGDTRTYYDTYHVIVKSTVLKVVDLEEAIKNKFQGSTYKTEWIERSKLSEIIRELKLLIKQFSI